jgi:hypothetical protein
VRTILRVLTAVWSFWFAAAFLELPAVHACAVHGAAAGQSAQHAHHHGAPQSKGPQCTCLSNCCSSTPAVITAAAVAVESSTIELPLVVFSAPLVVVTARPHANPFANGPPVA